MCDPRLLTTAIHHPPQPVSLDVVHSMDPPREFTYTLINDQVVKHYTDNEFYLLCYISNLGREICHLHRLACFTEQYVVNNERTLRLVKPKGIFEPPVFRFRPSTSPGSETDVLNGRVWQIAGENREVIKLALSNNVPAGCYQVSFRALGTRGSVRVALRSASFPLRCGAASNELMLMVAGKHYDAGAEAVLRSSDEIWNRLVALSQKRGTFLYLGPTLADVLNGRSKPQTWIVQRIQAEHDGQDLVLDGSSEGELVVDLGIPIHEELYSLSTAAARAVGQDEWMGLLPVQLERRRRGPGC